MLCKSSVSVIVPARLPKTTLSTGHTVVNWDFEIDLLFADGSRLERVSSAHAEQCQPIVDGTVLERTFRGITFRREVVETFLSEYARQQLAMLEVDNSVDVVLVSEATFWLAAASCQFKKLSTVSNVELGSCIQSVYAHSGGSSRW